MKKSPHPRGFLFFKITQTALSLNRIAQAKNNRRRTKDKQCKKPRANPLGFFANQKTLGFFNLILYKLGDRQTLRFRPPKTSSSLFVIFLPIRRLCLIRFLCYTPRLTQPYTLSVAHRLDSESHPSPNRILINQPIERSIVSKHNNLSRPIAEPK